MDNYIVSARKYRPTTFQSVVGQKALVQTLKAAVATRKLAHAYLFCGTRGVGKTTCARIFAKTINCMHPTPDGEACNECESCRAFNEQRSLNIMELDAASNNSVEDIRQLIDKVRIPPQLGQYKVYIIDEVHMLSTAAFNAFLKTLEEPPHHAIFILATTEKHKLLPTILSRCQIYDFQRITLTDIAEHLRYVATQEGIAAEDEALNIIAQKADGGMRDALSIFDQVASSSGGNITYQSAIDNLNILDYDYYFRLTDALLGNQVPQALMIFDEVLRAGFAAQLFINGLSSHFRDLMVSRDAVTRPLLEVGAGIAERYAEQSARCSNAFLYQAMDLSNRCDLDYRISNNKRLLVELMLIKICQLSASPTQQSQAAPSIQRITPATTTANPTTAARPTAAKTNSSATSTYTPPTATPAVASEPRVRFTPPPPPPTTPSTRSSVADKSFSIKNRGFQNEIQKSAPVKTVAVEMNERFTQEQLESAWLQFAHNVSSETFLSQTMQSCMPQLINALDFEVVVDNRGQVDRLNARATDLLSFLRTALKNSHIEMYVRESEKQERRRAYSPGERFVLMAEKNPDLNLLKEAFSLELA
ncbi:MAG: DNA polymerase III subunit gamma/tau [Coprobacter sp.]|nr:DNA polymerase III subunit gamma/tau [Coprobacter sp.]